MGYCSTHDTVCSLDHSVTQQSWLLYFLKPRPVETSVMNLSQQWKTQIGFFSFSFVWSH